MSNTQNKKLCIVCPDCGSPLGQAHAPECPVSKVKSLNRPPQSAVFQFLLDTLKSIIEWDDDEDASDLKKLLMIRNAARAAIQKAEKGE